MVVSSALAEGSPKTAFGFDWNALEPGAGRGRGFGWRFWPRRASGPFPHTEPLQDRRRSRYRV